MKKIKQFFKNKYFTSSFALMLIILIASILRLYQLGSVPLSPDWDEAALGYNAYSIMQTGHDEYGKFLPAVLQSFNDFKPAAYAYLTIPSVALFGLTPFAVRLPSALFGILTVFATYFLTKALFGSREITQNNTRNYAEVLALLSAFLLAISPWHIQFSRVAFETNIGLACNVLLALFFLKSLKKPWLLAISAFFAGVNFSVYQSDRVFTPLLVLVLALIYRKELFALPKKYFFSAVAVGVIALSPFLFSLATNSQALDRAKGVSIFSSQTPIIEKSNMRYSEDKNDGNVIGMLFHNKRVAYGREILSGYLSHYDLNWLFIKGDIERHHAPGMGLLYLWELPFFLIGLYALFFFQFPLKTKLFIFAWFLVAPLPASITNDVPHAVRTLNFLPTLQILVACGIVSVFSIVNKYQVVSSKYYVLRFFALCYLIFALGNITYYLNQYFVQQNYVYAKQWQYGYAELVPFVNQMSGSVGKVVISDVSPFDQSYIFFLFYEKYNPAEYQTMKKIHNYEFRPIDWTQDKTLQNVLFVGTPDDFPIDSKPIKTISYPDGSVAMEVVKR